MTNWRVDTLAAAAALGTPVCVDPERGVIWFDSDEELRRTPGAPDVPEPLYAVMPVDLWDPSVRLTDDQSPALSPFWAPGHDHFAWVGTDQVLYWSCSPRAFALLTRPSTSDDRVVKLLALATRALAHLAPETPASASEVQALMSLRAATVRAARPPAVARAGRRTRWSRVGAWLERLSLGLQESSAQRRAPPRRAVSLDPLGGPGNSGGKRGRS